MARVLIFIAILVYYVSPYISEILLSIIFGLITLITLLVSRDQLKVVKLRPLSSTVLLYYLVAVFSVLWSQKTAYTLFFGLLNISILLGVLKTLNCSRDLRVARTIKYLTFIVVLEIIFMAFQLGQRGYGGMELLHGSGSFQAGIVLLIVFYEHKSGIERNALLVTFGLIVLLTTSFKIYLAFGIILWLRMGKWVKILLPFLGTTCLFYFKDILFTLDYGKIENLGGRLGPWLLMLESFQENIILGHGFPFGDRLRIDANFTIENAHNIFIASGLYLGLVGLIMMVFLMYRMFKSYHSGLSRDLSVLFFTSSMFNVSVAGKISGTLIAGLILLIFIEKNRKDEVLQTRL